MCSKHNILRGRKEKIFETQKKQYIGLGQEVWTVY